MNAQNVFSGVIKELEIIRSDGAFFRSGLLTDANLEIKANPIKKRLSGDEAVLAYDVSFTAELAEYENLDDIKRFNNSVCVVLFDAKLGSERTLDTLEIADGEFIPLLDGVRLNVHTESDFNKPGGVVIVLSGKKRVKKIHNNVLVFSAEKLAEIKNRFVGTVMDFNVYGDLDMNDADENYDFNIN